MRPITFSANLLRQFLRRNRIATLPELKQVLGTPANITVFRKLKELSYQTSYSHRGRFYTLDEIADFDEHGLWSFDSVRFSRHGSLVTTAEAFVNQAPAGYFATELEALVHVSVKEPLLQLVRQGKIVRQEVSALYLYCARDSQQRQQQVRARQARLQPPSAAASVLRPIRYPTSFRRRSSCSAVHWTSSNGVCTLAWSPSRWGTAETIRSLSFFIWILTQWPKAGANYWSRMWTWTEYEEREVAASRWKKNA